jgi:hypothetical protein
MTGLVAFILVLAVSLSPVRDEAGNAAVDTRFTTVHIYLDAGDHPLAAYQLDFTATAGQVQIVGIEGGDHPALTDPPHYDPKAIQQQRIILAWFSTADADQLPTGRTRIATIHLQISGDTAPTYALNLTAAADPQGKPIKATAELQEQTP